MAMKPWVNIPALQPVVYDPNQAYAAPAHKLLWENAPLKCANNETSVSTIIFWFMI
jgi:hypothetical protein